MESMGIVESTIYREFEGGRDTHRENDELFTFRIFASLWLAGSSFFYPLFHRMSLQLPKFAKS
jgi:hypothetical protein